MSPSELTSKLSASLDGLPSADPQAILSEVRDIQLAFRTLCRSLSEAPSIISLKFQMQHWREAAFDRLIRLLQESPDALPAIAALSELQYKPDQPKSGPFTSWLKKVRESGNAELMGSAANYLADIAEPRELGHFNPSRETSLLAGPVRKLPILANAPSRCVFSKWSKDPDFARYCFEDSYGTTGVRYRGLSLLPGDLLVSNVNRDGNGIYTVLQSPRGYGYHLGVFAILSSDLGPLPVVLEGYKLGVRAVPLSTFFTPRFNSYVEVCRLKDPPESFFGRINSLAANFPDQVKGYNFDTEDPDRSYLSCTTVASALFERAGVQPISTKSRYLMDSQIRRNMDAFEFGVDAFLSPTDFIVDDRISIVGAVDNGHFHKNVARELAERKFVEIFQSGELDTSELPLLFQINRFGVRQMRSGSFLGKIIGLPYGLTQENLPRGPEKVLAIIEIYEHQLKSAVRRAAPVIKTHWDTTCLIDIDALARDPAIGGLLESLLAPIARAFKVRKQAVLA